MCQKYCLSNQQLLSPPQKSHIKNLKPALLRKKIWFLYVTCALILYVFIVRLHIKMLTKLILGVVHDHDALDIAFSVLRQCILDHLFIYVLRNSLLA
jgi:hypothetical protein